jgi:hypothetical protein
VAANSYWHEQELQLPRLPEHLSWRLFADTYAAPPRDAYQPGTEPRNEG